MLLLSCHAGCYVRRWLLWLLWALGIASQLGQVSVRRDVWHGVVNVTL